MSNTIGDNQQDGSCSNCPWALCMDFEGFCPIDYLTSTRAARVYLERQIRGDNPEALLAIIRDEMGLEYTKLFVEEAKKLGVFGEKRRAVLDMVILLNEKKSGVSLEEAYELHLRRPEVEGDQRLEERQAYDRWAKSLEEKA